MTIESLLTQFDKLLILPKMAKLRLGETEIEGEFVAFVPIREDWNEYRIGNFILKTKQVVSEIFKAKDQKDAVGNPLFYLQSNAVSTIRKVED
jgi:hypothetical protein